MQGDIAARTQTYSRNATTFTLVTRGNEVSPLTRRFLIEAKDFQAAERELERNQNEFAIKEDLGKEIDIRKELSVQGSTLSYEMKRNRGF